MNGKIKAIDITSDDGTSDRCGVPTVCIQRGYDWFNQTWYYNVTPSSLVRAFLALMKLTERAKLVTTGENARERA